jgi:hypothetical protein
VLDNSYRHPFDSTCLHITQTSLGMPQIELAHAQIGEAS